MIPTRQQELDAWSGNFADLLVSDPGRYGVTADQAQSAQELAVDFHEALEVVLEPSTKTKTTVAQKDIARAAMLQFIRPLARQISENLGVSPDDKIALGLTVPDVDPSPIPPPVSAPVLTIVAATPLEHRLRYADQNNATSRAKPQGVAGMQLVRTVSDTPPSGPATAQLVGVVTRQPYIVQFEPEDAKKTAYYWGRWQTAAGKVGPWSQVASMTVAA